MNQKKDGFVCDCCEEVIEEKNRCTKSKYDCGDGSFHTDICYECDEHEPDRPSWEN